MKYQIFDEIFAKNPCDQKLLLVTFYVKLYLVLVCGLESSPKGLSYVAAEAADAVTASVFGT